MKAQTLSGKIVEVTEIKRRGAKTPTAKYSIYRASTGVTTIYTGESARDIELNLMKKGAAL